MIIKKSIKFIFLIFASIVFYIVLSFTLLLFPSQKSCNNDNKIIYLYTDDIHSEIIIPIKEFDKSMLPKPLRRYYQGYLAFSYGDRDFLMNVPTWDDLDIVLTLKSLFINTPALIRVCHYWNIKKDLCIKIELSDKCIKKLQNSIFGSFSKNLDHFIRYDDRYKEPNIFYFQAKKSYNLFHTCNSWTGDRLKDAGLKASYLTPFAQQVRYPYLKD